MGNLNNNSEQVNFDKLIGGLNSLIIRYHCKPNYNGDLDEDVKNINTFFNMLTKSSTFAHLAHKELKRRADLKK